MASASHDSPSESSLAAPCYLGSGVSALLLHYPQGVVLTTVASRGLAPCEDPHRKMGNVEWHHGLFTCHTSTHTLLAGTGHMATLNCKGSWEM